MTIGAAGGGVAGLGCACAWAIAGIDSAASTAKTTRLWNITNVLLGYGRRSIADRAHGARGECVYGAAAVRSAQRARSFAVNARGAPAFSAFEDRSVRSARSRS